MYHAIGKEEWDNLPTMFLNSVLAEQLDKDENWWCYTNMTPHAHRTKYEPLLDEHAAIICEMKHGVSYSKSTGYFTKFMQMC